ncbi:MAG: hypothetical protein WBO04_01800 [Steroidobacteraceae bacterium]
MARRKLAEDLAKAPDFVDVGGVRWPVLSAEAMAALCGFGQEMLRKLERAGVFSKLARDRYSPPDVIAGVLAHMRDEERRSTKSAEARRVLEARAREIEVRTAVRTGNLIDMDTLCEHFAMIIGTFRSELGGVPAAATRDLSMRARIEAPLEDAITRARDSFANESRKWGEYAAKLTDERIATLPTSLADAPPPGESVVETAYAAVRAARTNPPRRATRKAMKR